jgi:hypothetical protein
MAAQEIDRERTERLAAELLKALKPELARQPFHSDNVLVGLNALAFCVVTLLAGVGHVPKARKFYDEAFEQNLAEMREHRPGSSNDNIMEA